VFDCGVHGRLTAREIAKRAGLAEATIYQRFASGVRGEALLKPDGPRRRGVGTWRENALRATSGCDGSIAIALQLVRDFGATPPLSRTCRSGSA
jgi:hypothetical protein